MKIAHVLGALLVLAGLLPAAAFAVGPCSSNCVPISPCSLTCMSDFGFPTNCGVFKCCVTTQVNCGSEVAVSSRPTAPASEAGCWLASPSTAARPLTALPAFLAE